MASRRKVNRFVRFVLALSAFFLLPLPSGAEGIVFVTQTPFHQGFGQAFSTFGNHEAGIQ